MQLSVDHTGMPIYKVGGGGGAADTPLTTPPVVVATALVIGNYRVQQSKRPNGEYELEVCTRHQGAWAVRSIIGTPKL